MKKKKSHVRDLFRAAKENPVIVAIVLLCLSCFALFAGVADEVAEGDTLALDKKIMLALRNPADITDPLGGPWLEEIMRDLTGLGGVFVLCFVTIAILIYLLVTKRRSHALYLGLSIGTGLAFSSVLKYGFDRPRPDLVPHGSFVYTSSFPSGHSLMSALVYLTLGALLAEFQPNRALKIYILAICVTVTLMVGCSRVYLGVHWPTDVLAGWLAGASWAMLTWLVWARVLHNHKQRKS